MKKLYLKLISIVLLMCITQLQATEAIEGTANRTNATPIETNVNHTLLPTHNSAYKGTPQKYGYYSFVVAENTQASITYTAPSDGGSWLSLRKTNGQEVTSTWISRNTTGTLGPVTLEAGSYHFIVNKNGAAEKSIALKVTLANDDNGDGGDNTAEGIIGTANKSNATAIEVNKNQTLLPTHNGAYKGIPQKYGYYSFVVPKNSEATMSYTAPDDGGSWMSLRNSNGSEITNKWIAKGSTGTVGPVTLTAGSYYFYLNKDGGLAKHIMLRVSLVENSGGNTTETYTAPYKVLPVAGEKYFGAMPSFSDEDIIPSGKEEKEGKKIIREFDKLLVGHKATWTYMSDNWGTNNLDYPKAKISMILSTNKIPFVRMMPIKGTSSGVSPMSKFATYDPNKTYPLAEIATNPLVISKIEDWAKAAKDHYEESARNGKPFYLMLDFAPEMNGYWFQWGGAHQKPSDYVSAYRKIIDIFREEEVPHVTWVFHPVLTDMKWYEEQHDDGLRNFQNYLTWAEPANYYPGDDYIDWVGFSIYGRDDYMAKKSDDYYPSFDKKLEIDDGRIFNFAPHKPRMVAEFGVIENRYKNLSKPLATKAIWLREALKSIKGNDNIYAMTYWNQSWKDKDGHPINMSIDSSKESKAAFNDALNEIKLVDKSDMPRAE